MQHGVTMPTDRDCNEDGSFKTYGNRGVDFGEMGKLLSEGKISIPSGGFGQYTDEWDTLLLLYINYKQDVEGVEIKALLDAIGIPDHHRHWLNTARTRLRMAAFWDAKDATDNAKQKMAVLGI